MYQNGFVVAVKINNQTVEERDGKVVMPFDSEYSLMLKNRNDRKSVARVYIDGEEVTKTGRLILDANDSINLERYIVDMNNGARFKFVPLSDDRVHDKGDSEKGFIEVRFQLVKPTQSQVIVHEEHIYHHKHHHWNDWWDQPYYTGPFYTTFGNSGNSGSGGTTCGNFTSLATNTSSDVTKTFSCSDAKIEAKVEGNQLIEEGGATIKGSNSSQKFSYSYVGELEAQETVIRFQLVGTKDKKVAEQYMKTHCVQCGRKYGATDLYCATCGTKK